MCYIGVNWEEGGQPVKTRVAPQAVELTITEETAQLERDCNED